MRIFDKLSNWYFSKNSLPYWGLLLADLFIIILSYYVTYFLLRPRVLNWVNIPILQDKLPELIVWISMRIAVFSLCYLIGMRIFKTYSGIIRYSSFVDLLRITGAMLVGGLVAWIIHYPAFNIYTFNTTVGSNFEANIRTRDIIIATFIATFILWLLRIIVKLFYDVTFLKDDMTRIAIYGIRSDGIALAKTINTEKPKRFQLKLFVTDFNKLCKHKLIGKPVISVSDNKLKDYLAKYQIKAFVVAPQNHDSFRDNTYLQQMLIEANIKIYIIPRAQEWHEGDAITSMREIHIEDLLPRNEININLDEVNLLLKNKCVCITGAAGSIGSEIVRQIATFNPRQLLLIDQAETPQHDVKLMMKENFPNIQTETIVCSICRKDHMEKLFSTYRPEYVFHAAAYKHVPMMEDNPSIAVLNNILGTQIIADLSVKYGVKKFVMISTDKAVNPTNVMGCSKRICEIYTQSLNHAIQEGHVKGETEFVTTRFGNVLGSNGSVIPIFKKQIQAGGPITVTHPEIIRFFMLISEAVKLVLEAGTHGKGGQILVFNMGKPVKIVDLARKMIRLSENPNVKIQFTGLREGEKLYEEILDEDESTIPAFHPLIKVAIVREYSYNKICQQLEKLYDIAHRYTNINVVKEMMHIVPEYTPQNSEYQFLKKEKNNS